MMIAAVLAAYTVALATAGTSLLGRADWPDRAPRLGVLAWQALVINVVCTTILAVLAATAGVMGLSMDLARLLHVCVMNMRAASSTPLGAVGVWFTAGAALALAMRVSIVGIRASLTALEARRRTRTTADLVGHADPALGVTVIDHGLPFAFCVPGGAGRIVVTSAALRALDDDQLAAVLAHERAHLRSRHHLIVGAMAALCRSVPFLPAFKSAASEVARLVELDADDHAIRVAGRHALSGALDRLGYARIAPPLLAASAVGVEGRLARARQDRHLSTVGRTLVSGVIGLGFAAPVFLALAPAVVSTALGFCSAS